MSEAVKLDPKETRDNHIRLMEAMLRNEDYGPWMIGSIKYLIAQIRGLESSVGGETSSEE